MKYVPLALVVPLAIAGCAHETPASARAATSLPESGPPEELLAAPGATAPSQTLTSRFETRRIGEAPADGPVRVRGSGRLIDLDVKDADIQDVLRLIADVGKVNLVVDAAVAGRVTMRLRQVPWQQALAAVTSTKGLAVMNDGELLIVRGAR